MAAPAALVRATDEQGSVPMLVLKRPACSHIVAAFVDTSDANPIRRARFLADGHRRKLKAVRTTVAVARMAPWCNAGCPHRPSVGGRRKAGR